MKRFHLLLVTVYLLSACRERTEVSNGAHMGSQPPTNAGTETPTPSESKTDSGGESILPEPLRFLTSPCASPLAEPMQGRFVNSSYNDAVTITVDGAHGQKHLVSRLIEYHILPSPTSDEPSAIQVTPLVGPIRCSLVTNQAQSDSSTVRSVALDGIRTLSWTLKQGQVTSFRIQNTPESQVFEFQLDTSGSGLE
jgi:hypothetical protein